MTEPSRVFLVRAGKHGADEDVALEKGLALVGFTEIPSLEKVKDYDGIFDLVAKGNPGGKPRALGNLAGQLWAFALSMKEGDLVVLPRKLTSQIALGRVVGPYKFQKVDGAFRHTRPIEWIKTDLPRTAFAQDLLYSFGAFMTVCQISRNEAETRIAAVLKVGVDPALANGESTVKPVELQSEVNEGEIVIELGQLAHDQVVARIQTLFKGHDLARLVDAVLQADGWVTRLSPPGPDGGVDILAGRGPLGLDQPRLCVQVKSGAGPSDVTVYRNLLGVMQTFKADQGLLVCWGGYNKAVLAESKQNAFVVKLWDSGQLVEAIYRLYDKLPAEIQAELPLKRVWMLVMEGE